MRRGLAYLVILIASGAFFANSFIKRESLQKSLNPDRPPSSIQSKAKASSKDLMIAPKASQLASMTPLAVAQAYLQLNRSKLRLQAHHELRPILFESPIGTTVKYQVFQDGIPVLGLGIHLRIGGDLNIESVENQYLPLDKAELSQESQLSLPQVISRASDRYLPHPSFNLEGEKPLIFYVNRNKRQPELAYIIPVVSKTAPQRSLQVIFRATDGYVLGKLASRPN